MRCKFCGSQSLRADQEHRNFSVGKAVAGAAIFGPYGAIGGFVGKDLNGFRCGSCGAFMDAPMDLFTEHQIDNSIADAEAGRSAASFQYYQRQYPNIQANAPVKSKVQKEQIALPVSLCGEADYEGGQNPSIKHIYRNLRWNPTCPIYAQTITIFATDSGDTLSLSAWNQYTATVRSAYFSVAIYDDTGDEIGKQQCVYQGLSVAPGNTLPEDKTFSLQTDLAYRVELVCEKVAFLDDSVWRAGESNREAVLVEQPELTPDSFPRLKYVRQHLSEVSTLAEDNVLYLPVEGDTFWQCICGQPVENGHTCPRCKAELEKLNHLLEQKHLRELQQAQVKERAMERAGKTMALYEKAVAHETKQTYQNVLSMIREDNAESLRSAIVALNTIQDYRDAAQQIEKCTSRIHALEEQAEKEREAAAERERLAEEERIQQAEKKKRAKARNKKVGIIISALAACVVVVALFVFKSAKDATYHDAAAMLEAGEYEQAISLFESLGSFGDSAERAQSARNEYRRVKEQEKRAREQAQNEETYDRAEKLYAEGNYEEAISTFDSISGYKDAYTRIEAIKEEIYGKAVNACNEKDFNSALRWFDYLGEYKNSQDYFAYCAIKRINFDDGEIYNMAELYREINRIYDEALKNDLMASPQMRTIETLNGKWYKEILYGNELFYVEFNSGNVRQGSGVGDLGNNTLLYVKGNYYIYYLDDESNRMIHNISSSGFDMTTCLGKTRKEHYVR